MFVHQKCLLYNSKTYINNQGFAFNKILSYSLPVSGNCVSSFIKQSQVTVRPRYKNFTKLHIVCQRTK